VPVQPRAWLCLFGSGSSGLGRKDSSAGGTARGERRCRSYGLHRLGLGPVGRCGRGAEAEAGGNLVLVIRRWHGLDLRSRDAASPLPTDLVNDPGTRPVVGAADHRSDLNRAASAHLATWRGRQRPGTYRRVGAGGWRGALARSSAPSLVACGRWAQADRRVESGAAFSGAPGSLWAVGPVFPITCVPDTPMASLSKSQNN
jgi:hypothetical protein